MKVTIPLPSILIATGALTAAKLTGLISWSWIWVFAPVWIFPATFAVGFFALMLLALVVEAIGFFLEGKK